MRSSTSTDGASRRFGFAALASALALVLTAGGCASFDMIGQPQGVVVVTETVATVTGAPTQGGVDTSPPDPEALPEPEPPRAPESSAADLDAVVAASPLTAGIAVGPVGGAEISSAGAWQTGVAWSTIKVPLAIAVARVSPQPLEANATAITVSDNPAADNLWAALGGGTTSSSSISTVLAEGGDTTSQVPSTHTRPGYSIYGQTRWSLADQTRFATALPCLSGAARVVDLMGQISPAQRWGLGRIPGARFKGGWGPGENGGYLVRQFGLVPGAGGDVAVSIAVEAPTFESGTGALSTMADTLAPQLASIQGGTC